MADTQVYNIATLRIDVGDVNKRSAELLRRIEELRKAQKELDKTTEEGSQAFAENAVQLKQLNKAYRDNQNFASALSQANEDLTETMSTQNKSVQELRDSRSQLIQISKNLKGETEEEIILRDKLNDAIDEQTKALRVQSSEYTEGKDRVGEYKQSILEAVDALTIQKKLLEDTQKELQENINSVDEGTKEYNELVIALARVDKELDDVNSSLGETDEGFQLTDTSLSGLITSAQESGGAFNLLRNGLKAAVTGMMSLIKAAAAFIATPIGVVAAAIGAAFLLVRNAMQRSEESTTRVRRAMAGLGGMVGKLLAILQPLGEYLIDGLVKGFELVEKGVTASLRAIERGLRLLGLENAAASMGSFNAAMEEGAEQARELTQAQLDYDRAQREANKTQLSFQNTAEKLRQVRDDETKSIQERIKANEELSKVLNDQISTETELAQKALELAKLRIKLDGETKENLDEQAAAEEKLLEIEERITGQRSEQLTNRVSLEKEAQKQITDAQAAEQKERDAIEKARIEAAQERADESVKLAKYELDEYIRVNESKLDSDKLLTDEMIAEEKRRLDALAQQRREYAQLQLEAGKISQLEYNEQINQINRDNEAGIKEADDKKKEQEQEASAIEMQNELELLDIQAQNRNEITARHLEESRQKEIEEANKVGADVTAINKKYALRQAQVQEAVTNQRLEDSEKLFGNIQSLLGESTAAGKAAGIAQATINTYQGITEVFKTPSTLPEPFATVSRIANAGTVAATGFQTVSKISGVSTQFEDGGVLQGNSHKDGGIPFTIAGKAGFEAEGGEAIINKRSTAMFKPLLSQINMLGGGRKFAEGGIAGGSNVPTLVTNQDAILTGMQSIVENLPNPIVSVEEINTTNTNVSVVEDLATL